VGAIFRVGLIGRRLGLFKVGAILGVGLTG